MRKQIADFLRLCWGTLRIADKKWNTEAEFFDWASTECEVDARAYIIFLSKHEHEHDELWGPDNCRLVNVWSNSDFNKILAGAFKQGGDHEYL